MRDYLRTLHTRSEHHKKRFSMIVAGCFTLLIFAVWLEVRFGPGDTQTIAAAQEDTTVNGAPSPLESLRASATEAWSMFSGQLDKAKEGLKSVDLENNYTQARNDALNTR